ncbi:MAG TPA: metallophosphoesterase [Vicinamibacteria bacterium]|nr:metallophosphoesterase [Vicinamibacteria bacterium]
MRQTRRLLPLLVASAFLPPAAARAAEGGCPNIAAPRAVAVGDVHGEHDRFLSILRFSGIVNEKGRWSGGKAHLVQTGDVLDRGKEGRKVLDLLIRLEGEARKAGGRVHALLGNHEVMNMLGDLRYVNKEEYESYKTPDSESLRQHFLESAAERAQKDAQARGETFDPAAFRTKFVEQVPLGFVERTQAFSAEGRYGKWLRQRPVVVKVNGVVFLHGGLTPEVAALGCEAVNGTVRREITDDIDKTLKDPLATLAAGENGPLWYRGLSKEDEAAWLPSVERVLQSLGARAVVVGHSVTGDGRIKARFGGRVIGIDVGMGEGYGGSLAALEIGPDGSLSALYPEGREEILRPAAAAARVLRPAAPGLDIRLLAHASR